MKLMSAKDLLDLIEKYKEIYEDDYEDIVVQNGGVPLRDVGGKEITLGLLEKYLEPAKELDNPEYAVVNIEGKVLLSEYELLDSNTINIHLPTATIIL